MFPQQSRLLLSNHTDLYDLIIGQKPNAAVIARNEAIADTRRDCFLRRNDGARRAVLQ
jgi:hypothetical protein